MVEATSNKCAHTMCNCEVVEGEKFCSTYCHDAYEEKETEIECDCKHECCAV